MPLMFEKTSLLPLGKEATGLIPNDVTFRLRVDNPYQVSYGTNENFGHNLYRFKIEGKQADLVSTKKHMKMLWTTLTLYRILTTDSLITSLDNLVM